MNYEESMREFFSRPVHEQYGFRTRKDLDEQWNRGRKDQKASK